MPSSYDYIPFYSEDGTFIDLPSAQYQALLEHGSVAYDWSDTVHLPHLCLVRLGWEEDGEVEPYDFGYEAECALNFLLDNAVLARPRTDAPHRLELVTPMPLRKALWQSLPPTPQGNKGREEYQAVFKSLFHHTLRGMFPAVLAEVQKTGRYLGQISICTCQEPMCAAACGWIENYTGLVFVDSGSAIVEVKAYLPAFI